MIFHLTRQVIDIRQHWITIEAPDLETALIRADEQFPVHGTDEIVSRQSDTGWQRAPEEEA